MPPHITFTARGIPPDTKLTVFSKTFVVSSTILKMHSNFFYKMLDPANKDTASEATSSRNQYRYEWITKIDKAEEGDEKRKDKNDIGLPKITWFLGSADDALVSAGNLDNFTGEKEHEEAAFEKLLCAFYNKHYTIYSVKEFLTMTALADYYCALPTLSKSLYLSLHVSRLFTASIPAYPCSVLIAARKLHHPILFREAVILSMRPWDDPPYTSLTLHDRSLFKIVRNARNDVSAKIEEAETYLKECLRNWSDESSVLNSQELMSKMIELTKRDGDDIILPKYYHSLFAWFKERGLTASYALSRLCNNNLILNSPLRGSHTGSWHPKDSFLCAEVLDEDLPWDPEETDW